jgi:Capsid protein (F protein).
MRRSTFNLSHEHKLSLDFGYLIPVQTQEVLPGDTFIGSSSALLRIAPLVNPLMHRVEVRLHHWFVPYRLVWDEFERFITGRLDTTVPQVTRYSVSKVLDHMGVPEDAGQVSVLPLRAYNLIYNEFYRDQDLQTARTEGDATLARICWQKDLFTIARPNPQQGDPIAIDGEISPAFRSDAAFSQINAGSNDDVRRWNPVTETWDLETAGDNRVMITKGLSSPPSISMDINDLRRSLGLQRIAEARAMFGSRYEDYLRFLGVNPSDGRLQRPEYCGGGKNVLNFSEVLATAEGASTAVGDMAGHGIGAINTRRFKRMFEEHGVFLTLMSVRPKTMYQNALHAQWLRKDATDFWHRELELLPWRELTQKEVYAPGSEDVVFGYVPQYEEYRHGVSYVSGSLRGGTENDWTMAREFSSPPTLNSSFVTCTPTDRVYADAGMPEAICSVINNLQARRLVRANASIGAL